MPKALELECKMLEDDLEHNRSGLSEDAVSILCFYEFVRMLKANSVMRCSHHVPSDHIEFYKQTVIRLVEGGVLPQSSLDDFIYVFSI